MGVKKGKDRPTRYASAGWAKGKPLLVEQGASQGRGVGAFWIYLDLVYLDLDLFGPGLLLITVGGSRQLGSQLLCSLAFRFCSLFGRFCSPFSRLCSPFGRCSCLSFPSKHNVVVSTSSSKGDSPVGKNLVQHLKVYVFSQTRRATPGGFCQIRRTRFRREIPYHPGYSGRHACQHKGETRQLPNVTCTTLAYDGLGIFLLQYPIAFIIAFA